MLKKSKTWPAPSRANHKTKAAADIVLVRRSIDQLKVDPQNPRIHSARQIQQIAASVMAFGFNVPVLVDANLNVIAGHGRIAACRLLGWTEVPTICLDHLTQAQARAFMIADNRLTEIAVWDNKLLAEQLQMLGSLDLDFSIEATGFDTPEIDVRIESLNVRATDVADTADVLPSQAEQIKVSKLDDLWLLGRHRVACRSALESSSYATLMQGDLAALVFTDPPYNVRIDGHASGLGAVRHKDFAMAAGEMSREEFTRFLLDFASLAVRYSKNGSIHFICIDWRHVDEMMQVARKIFSELKNLCVWVKHNAGMGSFYRSQHELIFVLKHGRGRHRNNVELGRHGRHRSNVWSYRGINDFGRGTDEGNLLALHPTVKPVAMVADAILDCSARGDIVLDPFLGSGTTMIAAERTGRRCYGVEIDPAYVDTIIRRWQAFTGDDARLAGTNLTFNHIEAKGGRAHVEAKKARRR